MSFISVAQMIALLLGIGALLILSMRLLQRLQWRLTFCYILVTVVAVPVLIIPRQCSIARHPRNDRARRSWFVHLQE